MAFTSYFGGRSNSIKQPKNSYLPYDFENVYIYILNHNDIAFGFDVSGEGYIHMCCKRSIHHCKGRAKVA